KGILGSKPVIQGEGPSAGGLANLRHHPSMEGSQSDTPSTTVYVENRRPRCGARRNDPLSRYTIRDDGTGFDALGKPTPSLASLGEDSEPPGRAIGGHRSLSKLQQAANDRTPQAGH